MMVKFIRKQSYAWLPVCILILTLVFSLATAQDDETLEVRYLPPESETDQRSQYYFNLLELALEKTENSHGPYEMIPADSLTQRQALKAVNTGRGLDVVHTMTTKARELVLKPVPVPLAKGLIGMRLLMVREEDVDAFSGVSNKKDLRGYTFGQGHDWPDTEILEKNSLQVITSKKYEDLFGMLERGRFDAFPRAVYEIWDEIKAHPDRNLTVEPNVMLQYPAAMYFFVRKSQEGSELASRLETGLRRAISDGSFDELFNEYMQEYLDNAKLEERTVIKLENPMLPPDTPLEEEDLWYIN